MSGHFSQEGNLLTWSGVPAGGGEIAWLGGAEKGSGPPSSKSGCGSLRFRFRAGLLCKKKQI